MPRRAGYGCTVTAQTRCTRVLFRHTLLSMLQDMPPAKKTRRRRKPKPLPATWEYDVEPDWQPLINHVGPLLVAWFMYMGGGRLEDGSFVHAYKHIDTRRYFHIHDDGRCFVYDGDGSGPCTFIPVPRRRTVFPLGAAGLDPATLGL